MEDDSGSWDKLVINHQRWMDAKCTREAMAKGTQTNKKKEMSQEKFRKY